MDFILVLNKRSLVLTFIELLENDNESNFQQIVDFVTKGFTDDEERSVFKSKLIGNQKVLFKEQKLELFDVNINVMPDKSKLDYIVLLGSDLSTLNQLYFEKDHNKYQMNFLNSVLQTRTEEFLSK